MHRILTCLSVLGLIMLSSCVNVTHERLSFLSPGNGGIAVKADAKAKLLVYGEGQLAQNTAKSIMFALNKKDSKGLKIVTDDSTTPDYYIIVNVTSGYKAADKKAVPFNRSKQKVEKDGKSGGRDELITIPGRPDASGSLYASVAIYSTNKLEPVHYFDISANQGVFANKQGQIPAQEAFARKFVVEIGKKISDMMSTQKRVFDTAIPNCAEALLVNALKKGDPEKVKELVKIFVSESFDEYIARVKASKNRKEMTTGLCSLYILTVSQELNNFDIENLRTLHKHYYQIMVLAEDEGLAEACANSLGRIEKKAALTGNKI